MCNTCIIKIFKQTLAGDMIEWFYNFTIGANLTLLVLLCATLPKRVKYDANSEPKHFDRHQIRCALTTTSLVWVAVLSLFILLGIEHGIGPTSRKYYVKADDSWLPACFIMFLLYVYLFHKLYKHGRKAHTRTVILCFMKTYPSPTISLEKIHKFCKDNDLTTFPFLLFRKYLEKYQDEKEDVNGIAFEKMVNEMTEFKSFERMKVNDCDGNQNYRIYLHYCNSKTDGKK